MRRLVSGGGKDEVVGDDDSLREIRGTFEQCVFGTSLNSNRLYN